MATLINLSNTTPAAPGTGQNVLWQSDASSPTNVSAYMNFANIVVPIIVNATSSTSVVSLINTTAATSGTSQSSPTLVIQGNYWTGAASAADSWTFKNTIANGTNGAATLTLTHAGTTGTVGLTMPTGNLTLTSGNLTLSAGVATISFTQNTSNNYFRIISSPTTNFPAMDALSVNQVTTGATNFANGIVAINVISEHGGTGTINGVEGIAVAYGSSGGTAGVVSNAQGIIINPAVGAGGITTNTGLVISDCQLAGITNGTAINIQAQHGKYLVFTGLTSGSASIGVAAIAGTPNTINLPTTTGSANGVLQTDGGNPQQASWTNTPIHNTVTLTSATPTGSAGQVSFGTTAGFGNGSSGTTVTTTTLGTGSGPATPQTIVDYLEIDIAGTKYWIGLAQ